MVNRQILDFEAGGVCCVPNNQPSRPRLEDEETAKLASAKLEEGDVKEALRLLSSSDLLAPANAETHAALLSLHPHQPEDRRTVPPSDAAPIEVSAAAVKRAILSFPNGSSGGPDGLRPQHLKDLLAWGGSDIDSPLLLAITDLINFMLAGRTPEAVRSVFFGGSLTALLKVKDQLQ